MANCIIWMVGISVTTWMVMRDDSDIDDAMVKYAVGIYITFFISAAWQLIQKGLTP